MPRDGAPPLRLAHSRPQEEQHEEPPQFPPPEPTADGPGRHPYPAPEEGKQPFTPLGHDRGSFFFLTDRGRQVLSFSGKDLARDTILLQLAPINWLEAAYPGEKGMNTKRAANELIEASYKVGIYDPDRIRGRGAWIDGERSVLHMGSHLLVDHHEMPLDGLRSHYVYEANRPLSVATAEPLCNADAHRLVQICNRFSWERPVSGTLLAGWIAIAPICGALAWRPSIWLTGGSGSGKTTVQNKVIIPALGGVALQVQSKTSEAGIRQALGNDARPVVFDEAEREDQAAAHRMQAVLDLARQSSSEGGAEIIKGTANQIGARRYRVRSCFLFSSINVGLEHNADENRITVLTLSRPKMSGDEFVRLESDIVELLTPAFAAGLLARSVKLLHVIRANAETFARAAERVLGSRRAGDQLGALLAGAYSLHSTREISPEAAEEFVRRETWTEAADKEQEDTDEARLLAQIMQHRVRVGGGTRAPLETTVGLLVHAAGRTAAEPQKQEDENRPRPEDGYIVPHGEARATLVQYGIKYRPGDPREHICAGVYIANRHPDLARILAGTPWSAGWHRTLLRLPDADNAGNAPIRFGPGVVSKATFIPSATIEPPPKEESGRE